MQFFAKQYDVIQKIKKLSHIVFILVLQVLNGQYLSFSISSCDPMLTIFQYHSLLKAKTKTISQDS